MPIRQSFEFSKVANPFDGFQKGLKEAGDTFTNIQQLKDNEEKQRQVNIQNIVNNKQNDRIQTENELSNTRTYELNVDRHKNQVKQEEGRQANVSARLDLDDRIFKNAKREYDEELKYKQDKSNAELESKEYLARKKREVESDWKDVTENRKSKALDAKIIYNEDKSNREWGKLSLNGKIANSQIYKTLNDIALDHSKNDLNWEKQYHKEDQDYIENTREDRKLSIEIMKILSGNNIKRTTNRIKEKSVDDKYAISNEMIDIAIDKSNSEIYNDEINTRLRIAKAKSKERGENFDRNIVLHKYRNEVKQRLFENGILLGDKMLQEEQIVQSMHSQRFRDALKAITTIDGVRSNHKKYQLARVGLVHKIRKEITDLQLKKRRQNIIATNNFFNNVLKFKGLSQENTHFNKNNENKQWNTYYKGIALRLEQKKINSKDVTDDKRIALDRTKFVLEYVLKNKKINSNVMHKEMLRRDGIKKFNATLFLNLRKFGLKRRVAGDNYSLKREAIQIKGQEATDKYYNNLEKNMIKKQKNDDSYFIDAGGLLLQYRTLKDKEKQQRIDNDNKETSLLYDKIGLLLKNKKINQDKIFEDAKVIEAKRIWTAEYKQKNDFANQTHTRKQEILKFAKRKFKAEFLLNVSEHIETKKKNRVQAIQNFLNFRERRRMNSASILNMHNTAIDKKNYNEELQKRYDTGLQMDKEKVIEKRRVQDERTDRYAKLDKQSLDKFTEMKSQFKKSHQLKIDNNTYTKKQAEIIYNRRIKEYDDKFKTDAKAVIEKRRVQDKITDRWVKEDKLAEDIFKQKKEEHRKFYDLKVKNGELDRTEATKLYNRGVKEYEEERKIKIDEIAEKRRLSDNKEERQEVQDELRREEFEHKVDKFEQMIELKIENEEYTREEGEKIRERKIEEFNKQFKRDGELIVENRRIRDIITKKWKTREKLSKKIFEEKKSQFEQTFKNKKKEQGLNREQINKEWAKASKKFDDDFKFKSDEVKERKKNSDLREARYTVKSDLAREKFDEFKKNYKKDFDQDVANRHLDKSERDKKWKKQVSMMDKNFKLKEDKVIEDRRIIDEKMKHWDSNKVLKSEKFIQAKKEFNDKLTLAQSKSDLSEENKKKDRAMKEKHFAMNYVLDVLEFDQSRKISNQKVSIQQKNANTKEMKARTKQYEDEIISGQWESPYAVSSIFSIMSSRGNSQPISRTGQFENEMLSGVTSASPLSVNSEANTNAFTSSLIYNMQRKDEEKAEAIRIGEIKAKRRKAIEEEAREKRFLEHENKVFMLKYIVDNKGATKSDALKLFKSTEHSGKRKDPANFFTKLELKYKKVKEKVEQDIVYKNEQIKEKQEKEKRAKEIHELEVERRKKELKKPYNSSGKGANGKRIERPSDNMGSVPEKFEELFNQYQFWDGEKNRNEFKNKASKFQKIFGLKPTEAINALKSVDKGGLIHDNKLTLETFTRYIEDMGLAKNNNIISNLTGYKAKPTGQSNAEYLARIIMNDDVVATTDKDGKFLLKQRNVKKTVVVQDGNTSKKSIYGEVMDIGGYKIDENGDKYLDKLHRGNWTRFYPYGRK